MGDKRHYVFETEDETRRRKAKNRKPRPRTLALPTIPGRNDEKLRISLRDRRTLLKPIAALTVLVAVITGIAVLALRADSINLSPRPITFPTLDLPTITLLGLDLAYWAAIRGAGYPLLTAVGIIGLVIGGMLLNEEED